MSMNLLRGNHQLLEAVIKGEALIAIFV